MHSPVLWDGLADEWTLTPELRRLLDDRESAICVACSANARSMHLAAAFLDDLAKFKGRRYRSIRGLAQDPPVGLHVAEINEIPGVHKHIVGMPGLAYSEYGGENSQDLMALTYADAAFDYVLNSDTLEHVPHFDRALSEIHRVLKPGGKHIFTIPVIWDRATRLRASEIDGVVLHHWPPSYHGSPTQNDYLVINEFGGDVVHRIETAQFHVRIERHTTNPLIATFVCTRC